MTKGMFSSYDRLKEISELLQQTHQKINDAMMEVSFLQTSYCAQFFGDHDWEDKEPDEIMNTGPWQQCKRCGAAHCSLNPEKPKQQLRLVKNDDADQ